MDTIIKTSERANLEERSSENEVCTGIRIRLHSDCFLTRKWLLRFISWCQLILVSVSIFISYLNFVKFISSVYQGSQMKSNVDIKLWGKWEGIGRYCVYRLVLANQLSILMCEYNKLKILWQIYNQHRNISFSNFYMRFELL